MVWGTDDYGKCIISTPNNSQDQYEAAQIDGASKVQQFWYITVPHIKVVVGLLVVLRTIWVFNNFDIIYLLTGGGQQMRRRLCQFMLITWDGIQNC